MRFLLAFSLVLGSFCSLGQTPQVQRPASGHSSQNTVLFAAYGVAGRIPDNFRYAAGGIGIAYRNRWRYADADYDSDFTLGLRLGAGRQQAYTGAVASDRNLWGLNPYVAVDGRFYGAALGVWVGQLGDYRAEGTRSGRVVPQLRARGGQLTGWHGLLTYADEFGGIGNPPVHLGGAYGGLLNGRMRLGAGAAIPTLALPGQEVGLYAEAGLQVSAIQIGVYAQPPLGNAASSRFGLQLSLGGTNTQL